MTRKIFLGLALMLILLVPTTVLNVHADTSPPPAPGDSDKFNYNAGGSTFAYPIVDKWRVEYHGLYPGITLNYQPIGSGAGIKLYTSKKVDFAGTDAPLMGTQIIKAPKGTLTIPESFGAIVIVYNLPSIYGSGLQLTGDVIAKIFMGQITYWHDPAIVNLQDDPGMKKALSEDRNKIIVVHRSDGSGTTFAFTDYLSKVNSDWSGKVGHSTSVPWPTGMGGSGNAGVAAIVKKVPESIGYVELAYALNNKMASRTGAATAGVGLGSLPMTYAYIQNADGTEFLNPTISNMQNAASGTINSLPSADGDWSKVSINNAPGDSYPIMTYTYLLVNPNLEQLKGMSQQKAQDLVHMLYWFVTTGQQYATKLKYVPLPPSVQSLDEAGIAKIMYNGQQLWTYP